MGYHTSGQNPEHTSEKQQRKTGIVAKQKHRGRSLIIFKRKKCRAKFGICLKQNRLSGGEMRGGSVSGLTLSFPWNESVATVHGDMHSRP